MPAENEVSGFGSSSAAFSDEEVSGIEFSAVCAGNSRRVRSLFCASVMLLRAMATDWAMVASGIPRNEAAFLYVYIS